MFSDRPYRIYGHMKMSALLEQWDSGPDSFAEDPPNAVLSTFGTGDRPTGMAVHYTEARDGHNWENWRDRLREGLSWVFPGPLWMVYE